MSKPTDFAFDERVVNLYNRQRAHPPDVAQKIGAAIANIAGAGSNLLEIGVGTGRIAWPAAIAGCHVYGFDLSPHMLAEVATTAPPAPAGSLAVTRADMHAIPFADDGFDAALAVHVLHLADDWQLTLREIARVLRPGAPFIQGDDWIDPQSVVGSLRNELRMHAVRLDPSLMPPAAGISKAQVLADLGGTEVSEIVAAEWVNYVSPNERIAVVEQRIDAESWILSDELFEMMLIHLREFAAEKWGDLDAKQPVTRRFVLKITRGDW